MPSTFFYSLVSFKKAVSNKRFLSESRIGHYIETLIRRRLFTLQLDIMVLLSVAYYIQSIEARQNIYVTSTTPSCIGPIPAHKKRGDSLGYMGTFFNNGYMTPKFLILNMQEGLGGHTKDRRCASSNREICRNLGKLVEQTLVGCIYIFHYSNIWSDIFSSVIKLICFF